jgi:putative ABC transport system permease protein
MRVEHWLYTIPLRIRSLFRRRRVEQDLDDELRFHVEAQIAASVADGMPPEEARTRALRAIGGIEGRKEECRDARGVGVVEDLLRDTAYAFRTLRRDPGFVVSESVARRLWPQGDAIGRRFTRGDGQELSEVVGIVPDVHTETLESDPGPLVYGPLWEPQGVPPSSVVVRTPGDPSAAAGLLRGAVASLDRDLPLANVQTMREIEGAVLGERRFQLMVMAAFAAASLLLAAIGTYSVLAYAVARRTHEIAIRLALGASPARVRAMIVRQGIRPVLLGLGLGMAGALASGRILSGLLYGVTPTDPATFAAVVAVMLAAAVLACWIPARRVVGTSLLGALRDE